MKVAVVGAGVMGCATAWALRERGADVTVHEQFALDHDRGSSHGRTRIFRVAYPDPYWIRFAQEAYAGWQELDPDLLGLYGLVELVPDPALISARALDESGVAYRLLGKDEVRALGANLPDGWSALHIADAGVVFSDRARHAFLEAAGVEVETNRHISSTDELDADVVVVTAGPWVRELVPDLPVTVTRETLAYFAWEGPPRPCIVDLSAETRTHAMYSLHDPVHGLKAGAHHAGSEADPDSEASPIRRSSSGSRRGCANASPTSSRARSMLRRASTRRRPTRTSSSSAAAVSSSAPRARGTASSSRRRSVAGWLSWRSTSDTLSRCRSTSASETFRASATSSSGTTGRFSPKR